jgi:NTE family protein
LADNAPISKAVALGATRVVVLPTGYACALSEPPQSVLAHALHALTLLIERRLILDVAHYADEIEVAVLPPLCPLTVGPGDGHPHQSPPRPQPDEAPPKARPTRAGPVGTSRLHSER